MLTITISGVYLDPEAQPLPGISLVFKTAYNTTQTQLQTEVKTVTADDASYSIDLVPNMYSVSEVSDGRKKWLGNIQIFADSPPGSLNEYLTNFNPDLVRPEVLVELEKLAADTEANSESAAASAVAAKTSEDNAASSANEAADYAQQAKDAATGGGGDVDFGAVGDIGLFRYTADPNGKKPGVEIPGTELMWACLSDANGSTLKIYADGSTTVKGSWRLQCFVTSGLGGSKNLVLCKRVA
ncbi:prophage tail fiber N-terminal domain-containing protein [Citrobacter cronae]|uniref:prophage tail fiber N-terminal domain-containing protein n=1 Tax=Citrobacter cronae TaxID=1748967 RepID=UPI0021D28FF4|nr:prophage tail fiber N-terminal domain-containing protein [Citrobacter cronae]MCU6199129.1 prophage tail fiber N-terminal domain-containing protein [Citrobacter cronae]